MNKEISNVQNASIFILDIDHFVEESEKHLEQDPTEIAWYKSDASEGAVEILDTSCRGIMRSPSGDGMKIFYVLDREIDSATEYTKIWQVLADLFEKEHGFAVDAGTKNINRLCFISYDPSMYINEDAMLRYADIKEFIKEDGKPNTETIKCIHSDQAQIFLDATDHLTCEHYKTFRDLCSSASNLGADFLGVFYDKLMNASGTRFVTKDTEIQLRTKKDYYVKSFTVQHDRVPLQYIIDSAVRGGFDLSKYKSNDKNASKRTMFDYSRVKASIIKWMNENFALYDMGKGVLKLPLIEYKQYFDMCQQKQSKSHEAKELFKIMKRADFKEFCRNKKFNYYTDAGIMQSINYYDLWIDSPNRREAEHVITYPEKNQTPNSVNIWKGFNVDPERLERVREMEKESGKLVCQPVLDFIYEIICNEDAGSYELTMKWVADLIQNPTPDKPGVALILRGTGNGTGKGTFNTIVRDLIGPRHSTQVPSVGRVLGDFNGIIEGKVLISIDEGIFTGDKQAHKAFMSYVTEDTVTINKKHVESYPVDNITRFMLMTNEKKAISTSLTERRFYVLDVSPKRMQDFDYFTGIRHCMSNFGKESLFNYLMSVEYKRSDFDLDKYDNEANRRQKRQSFSEFQQWLVDVIRRGYLNKSYYTARVGDEGKLSLSYHFPMPVELADLWYDFNSTYNKGRHPVDRVEFEEELFEELLGMLKREKPDQGSTAAKYLFPPLNDILDVKPLYTPHGFVKPKRGLLDANDGGENV